jgi:hypothetical protein
VNIKESFVFSCFEHQGGHMVSRIIAVDARKKRDILHPGRDDNIFLGIFLLVSGIKSFDLVVAQYL